LLAARVRLCECFIPRADAYQCEGEEFDPSVPVTKEPASCRRKGIAGVVERGSLESDFPLTGPRVRIPLPSASKSVFAVSQTAANILCIPTGTDCVVARLRDAAWAEGQSRKSHRLPRASIGAFYG
jgi:hypothetical protein